MQQRTYPLEEEQGREKENPTFELAVELALCSSTTSIVLGLQAGWT